MSIDHFDGKSIARKSLAWLHMAAQDALAKRMDCIRCDSLAHENMWTAIGEKYSAEITRREARANKRAA